MGKLVSLEDVDATVLPAKVLVLLSKYAHAIRKHTGLVIKISSLNIFKHVHNTSVMSDHQQVEQLYRDLLLEVNRHLRAGTMRTYQQQKSSKHNERLRSKNGDHLKPGTGSYLKPSDLTIERSLSTSFH